MSRQTELNAAALIESHPLFRGRGRWIECRCLGGSLYLSGKLPSFYLKQLVQELLRELEGIERIENGIVVASPVGEVECKSVSDTKQPCQELGCDIRQPR